MSKVAKPLRDPFLRQLEGKTVIATSSNGRFRREFCKEGLVLGPLGQILFLGELSEAIEWADKNLEASEVSDSEEDQLEMGLDLQNADPSDYQNDDF